MPVINPALQHCFSDPTILRKSNKKNYIQENIKRLRQLEKRTKQQKKKEDRTGPLIGRRGQTVVISRSRPHLVRRHLILESKSSKNLLQNSSLGSPQTQIQISQRNEHPRRTKHHRPKPKAKAVAIQAEDKDEDTSESSESEKRVPLDPRRRTRSRSDKKDQPTAINEGREKGLPIEKKQSNQATFSPFNVDDIKREMMSVIQEVDYVRLNQIVQYKPKKNMPTDKSDPNKAPPNYQRGVLPKYLREQKKEGGEASEERLLEKRPERSPVRGRKLEQTLGKQMDHRMMGGVKQADLKMGNSAWQMDQRLASEMKQLEQSMISGARQVELKVGSGGLRQSEPIMIRGRRVEQGGRRMEQINSTKHLATPPGHLLITSTERKHQLTELRKQYAEIINKLNRLPIHVDSPKSRQTKTDLEKELENLESAITLLSKEKLFINLT